jgi:hypothetical protein
MRPFITLIICSCLALPAFSQQLLKGKIYDKATDSVLAAVTIFNSTRHAYALSSVIGDYAVEVNEGDRLVFTAVGYLPDTVKVMNYMIDAGYDITMALKNAYLKTVTLRGGYVQDSLNRREDYAEFYNKSKKQIVSSGGPQNGVGLAISPISFLAGRSKNRKLEANLKYQEEQEFVDYSFNRRYVQKLTRLQGDSLLSFMLRYRPSYPFCRAASGEDMLHYINDKFILYMHPDAEPDNKKRKK